MRESLQACYAFYDNVEKVWISMGWYDIPAYGGTIGQVLLLDNKVKGYHNDMDFWFGKAHESQLSFFKNLFTEHILNTWK